jgi:hypothetical protein
MTVGVLVGVGDVVVRRDCADVGIFVIVVGNIEWYDEAANVFEGKSDSKDGMSLSIEATSALVLVGVSERRASFDGLGVGNEVVPVGEGLAEVGLLLLV